MLKIGIVGLDTSHVSAFAELLHNDKNTHHVPGVQIAAAFPGGNPNLPASHDRIVGFRDEYQKKGIHLTESLEDLLPLADAFLLESVDGTQHLEQFRILAQSGKPIFIDKPLACSVRDAVDIARIAEKTHTPVMTASALRFAPGVADVLPPGERAVSAEAFGPMAFLPGYRDYFWYGIHTAEMLYRWMGTGCESVQTFSSEYCDLLVGHWNDGRIATLRGTRTGANSFGGMVTIPNSTKLTMVQESPPWYAALLGAVISFLQTGVSPVEWSESLEVIAFLEAASRSREAGGAEVKI